MYTPLKAGFISAALMLGINMGYSQEPMNGAPVFIPSTPTPVAYQSWQGGERQQISPWDQLPTLSNVSKPSLLAYLPAPEQATGTAIIIAPGGGFHLLSIANEGTHLAKWFQERGVAAFVLKYRLVPTGEDPNAEFMAKLNQGQAQMDKSMAPYIQMAKQDALSAIAYVRANAGTYKLDPDKIGIVGFSAGGTLAAAAGLEYTNASDRPDFIAPIYGALHVLPLQKLPTAPMPLFLAVSSDDVFQFQRQSIELYQTWNNAQQPAALHIYEKGGHGFGMRQQGLASDQWIHTFKAWMNAQGFKTR
jgi:acetyl esterase/lipase